ncbi:hypothetical protein BCAR13_440012 [Paraburkholderia caribensis]|nr:hypothetical protein BCAR13_440012 [Paraburkholderia caribensis]
MRGMFASCDLLNDCVSTSIYIFTDGDFSWFSGVGHARSTAMRRSFRQCICSGNMAMNRRLCRN